jgi:hypothetical protein
MRLVDVMCLSDLPAPLPQPAAETEVEVFIGSDRIIRVNIDSECRLRVRLGPDAEFLVRDERKKPWPRLVAV